MDSLAGLSPENAATIAPQDPLRNLVAKIRAHQEEQAGKVRIQSDGTDIGEFGRLEIGQAVKFQITPSTAGYLTLLNVGTCGAPCLLVPNAEVAPWRTKLIANRTVEFPTTQLLPGHPLFENGPPGFEEILALITKTPNLDQITTTTAKDEQMAAMRNRSRPLR